MRQALNETTNYNSSREPRDKARASDKDKVLLFLKDMFMKTKDYTLKYDLNKCMEIVEGKENQEVTELKNALSEALIENETLFAEKCELAVAIEHMRGERGE